MAGQKVDLENACLLPPEDLFCYTHGATGEWTCKVDEDSGAVYLLAGGSCSPPQWIACNEEQEMLSSGLDCE